MKNIILITVMIVVILALLVYGIYLNPRNAGIVGAVIGTMIFVIFRHFKNNYN